MFVTDSRYEIAVKTEVDHEIFDVSTKAEGVKEKLQEIKNDEKIVRIGLDGHLFTKTQVEAFQKVEGVEIIVNNQENSVVVHAAITEKSFDKVQYIDHELKYCGLSRKLKLAKVVQ